MTSPSKDQTEQAPLSRPNPPLAKSLAQSKPITRFSERYHDDAASYPITNLTTLKDREIVFEAIEEAATHLGEGYRMIVREPDSTIKYVVLSQPNVVTRNILRAQKDGALPMIGVVRQPQGKMYFILE